VSENGKLHQFSLFCLKREQKALDLEKNIKAHEEGYTKGPWMRKKDKRLMKECKEEES